MITFTRSNLTLNARRVCSLGMRAGSTQLCLFKVGQKQETCLWNPSWQYSQSVQAAIVIVDDVPQTQCVKHQMILCPEAKLNLVGFHTWQFVIFAVNPELDLTSLSTEKPHPSIHYLPGHPVTDLTGPGPTRGVNPEQLGSLSEDHTETPADNLEPINLHILRLWKKSGEAGGSTQAKTLPFIFECPPCSYLQTLLSPFSFS